MVEVVLRRAPERVVEDPVGFWLGRLDAATRGPDRTNLERFMRWLHRQAGWETVSPRELLVRHLEAEDPYVVLDLVQSYVNGLILRKSSKRKAYSAIRSYFAHNRCALPQDISFRVRGDRPPVEGRLTVNDVIEASHAAGVRNRSIILFKWQTLLDNERVIYANKYCAEQIVKQIQTGVHPVRVDLPGRKSGENDTEGRFYTYLGKDAIDALTKYFEEERGWPRAGQPIWTQILDPTRVLTKPAMEEMWLRLFRHMGKISKRKGPLGARYGYNLHEMRDVATTYLHVQAKAEGLDMDCVKLWCGQVGEIDPLKYDKFYKETDYVRNQYLTAEKHLNLLSNPNKTANQEKVETMQQQIQEQQQQLQDLQLEVRTLKELTHYKAIIR
ncbi:MAG TPA: hypothetical protein VLV31_09030 [Candidatus Acidoferrales bacterium]|nr:hypothetical protein [Candidatus Acidoferrales bacterium]